MPATKKSVASRNVDSSRKGRAAIHLAAGIARAALSRSRTPKSFAQKKALIKKARKGLAGTSVAAAHAHMTMRGSRAEISKANREAAHKAVASRGGGGRGRSSAASSGGGKKASSASAAARKAWVTRKRNSGSK